MLEEVFYWIFWIFNMSVTAGLTGLLVLPFRAIRRIPRRISVFLWAVPFLRMGVPLGLNSPYSLMALLARVTTKTTAIVVYQPAEDVAFSMTNSVMAANSYFPITYKSNVLDRVFGVASAVWIVVLLALILTLGILYVSTLRELKDAVLLRENIYLSDKIQSPAVYGIGKPNILLPTAYAQKNLEYVLLHERMHIRRADNLWRIAAFLITAVHWFNPLAWLYLKWFLADMELSCDERVLLKCGEKQAKAYARSLLDGQESKTVLVSAFGGAKIRTRISRILSFRKMTWISLLGFSALLTAIGFVLLTNAG